MEKQISEEPLELNARLLQLLGVAAADGRRRAPALIAVSLFMLLDVVSMVHFALGTSSQLAAVAEDVGLGLVGLSTNTRFLCLLTSARPLHALRAALAAAPAPAAAVAALESATRRVTLAFIAAYSVVMTLALTMTWLGPRDPKSDFPQLPLPHSLPVDNSSTLGFSINFGWQAVIMAVYALMMPSIDCTVAALLAHVALRLGAVAARLRDLREPRAAPGHDVRSGLRQCVREHQHALRLAEDAEKLLRIPLGVQLLSSTVIFCTMSYHVTKAESFHAVTFKGVLLIPVAVQLFIFCQLAHKVRQEAESIAEAAWSSGWEEDNMPVDVRNDLRMVVQRAQKPTRITALSIVEMSPGTFGEIMKLSYSYYNLLNEMGE